jgi:minor histocompatibility antigen H13
MVTVATKLDVPIKLIFEGPTRSSMLGLGDIVIPGMFIAICLRFDQYLYYHRQRKLVPVELKSSTEESGEANRLETQRMVVKPEYINPQNQWGDRFWSTRLANILSPDATSALKASAFPKPYFHAAMFGYLLAMVATLVVLLVFNHAQPALLYLVPGVVVAVWLTGAIRREIMDMWAYTEDGSLDKADVVVEVDGEGRVVGGVKQKEEEEKENDVTNDKGKKVKNEKEPLVEEEARQKGAGDNEVAKTDKDIAVPKTNEGRKTEEHCVFNFAIYAPSQ